MKKLIILICMMFTFVITYSEEEYFRAKIVSLEEEIEPQEIETDTLSKVLIYNVRALAGDRKGEIINLEFPIYMESQYNIDVKVGDNVVLYYENNEEGLDKYYIVEVDKRNQFIYLGIIFVIITFAIAKMKGIKAIIALVASIVFILKVFIPAIILGYSPILFAIITAFFSSFITIYLMTGFNSKGLSAILGSVGGVLISGSISYIFVNMMGLTGFETAESLSFAYALKGIRIKELISAGVIVGSMGAVMDVAMSISSALNEIKILTPDISYENLFKSGIKIGKDIIGTMINTLILAYIGTSLLMMVMIYMQSDSFPMIRIFNFENIAIEILRSFCGSIGILVSVPITSFISSKIYTNMKFSK